MNKKMYVIYDKVGLKSSPIGFYDNDVEAYRDLSLSLNRSRQSNPNLELDDFIFVCVGSFDVQECLITSTDTYVLDKDSILKQSSEYLRSRFNIKSDSSIVGNKEV